MKRIICVIMVAIMSLATLASCAPSVPIIEPSPENALVQGTAANDVKKDGYDLMAESGSLSLYLNKDTTHFKVVNKNDNSTYSTKTVNTNTDVENSLFDISYIDTKSIVHSMSSYKDSVEKGQYKVEKVENGFKVAFSLGEIQKKYFCPIAIKETKFKELLAKITDYKDKTLFQYSYYSKKVDFKAATTDEARNEITTNYPVAKSDVLYALQGNSLSVNQQEEIDRILSSIGYTEKDFEEDSKNSTLSLASKEAAFNLNLYVTLENGSLKVRMPLNEIKEFNGANLTDIRMLRTFGSPETSQKGYFVIPDGTGSKMNFYNGKGDNQNLQVSIYGKDDSIFVFEKPYQTQQAYLPIFITKYEDGGAILGEVTDSQACADIIANPGTANTYASQYVSFRYKELVKSYLSKADSAADFFYVTQKAVYDKDIALEYKFFDKGKAEMSDVTDYYKNKIFPEAKKTTDVAPIYLDFIGVAKEKTTIMGAATYKQAVFSTLKDVKAKGQELVDAGVTNLVFKLTGFLNDGIDASLFSKATLNKLVGTKEELADLINWGKQNNIPIYIDADVQYNSDYGLFDGFSTTDDAAYGIDRIVVNKPEFALSTGMNSSDSQMDTKIRYALKPESVTKATENVSSLLKELSVNNYSFTLVGEQLNSNYKTGKEITRQSAANMLKEDMEKVSKENSLLTSGANSYALPYMSDVLNLPSESLKYEIADGAFPIVQMVMDNKVHYADVAVNLNGDTKRDTLTALRTGAGFHYTVTTNPDLDFAKTVHKEIYSNKFDFWKENIIEKSKLLKETAATTKSGLKNQETLITNVYKNTYKDGSYMITNYTEKDYVYEGKTVKSLGYILGKVGS
ncbi:MAG: DUF5696 domain-containing protein [Clostridia bacterium]